MSKVLQIYWIPCLQWGMECWRTGFIWVIELNKSHLFVIYTLVESSLKYQTFFWIIAFLFNSWLQYCLLLIVIIINYCIFIFIHSNFSQFYTCSFMLSVCFPALTLSCIPLTCNSASSPYKTLSSTDQLGLSSGLTPSSRISSFPKDQQYIVRYSETTLHSP